MGLTKRHLEEVQAEEDMNEWIREQGDMFMVEGDEEWMELRDRYLSGDTESHIVSIYDLADEDYDSEISWTKEQRAFPTFKSQIAEVRKHLNRKSSNIALKMNYSYAVTLMESCLGDMLRSVIFSHPTYLLNAIKNVDKLKNCKFTLLEIYENEALVSKAILNTMSKDHTYHDIQRTVSVYENVLRQPLSKSIQDKMGEMKDIVNIRHDIVHRNGFDTDGEEHVLNYIVVCQAIDHTVDFVSAIKDYIDATEAKRVFMNEPKP